MNTTRTRPAGAPAYYLGRPAQTWRIALNRRRHQARSTDPTEAAARERDRMVARYSGTIR